jgi:hypothetical protein
MAGKKKNEFLLFGKQQVILHTRILFRSNKVSLESDAV